MSIFATSLSFDTDHADNCSVWVEKEHHREASGDVCNCGLPTAPTVYQGSHVLPSDDDERGGYLDFGEIARFIYRGDPPPDQDFREDVGYGWLHPYLRVFATEEGLILRRSQVIELRDYLSNWIERSAETPASPESSK